MTPIQTLYDCIKYFEEQNAMSVCKNCGLDKEVVDAALAEAYRNGENAGLAGICDDGTTIVTVPTPEGWKCDRENCATEIFHTHGTFESLK